MNIPIIYEDKTILALNKPSGLIVHSDLRNKEPTLVDWVLEKYPEIKNIGEPISLSNGGKIIRPGIVHRLDRETSGVIIVAKTKDSFEYLKKQFQDHKIKKTYMAIVYGHIKKDSGMIDKQIGKSRSDFRKWSAEYGARGKLRDAITEYNVLLRGKILESSKHKKPEIVQVIPVTHLKVNPKTGRTHQIRVHLKSIGHPVLCDNLYAVNKPCPREFGRLALHALSVEFKAISGEYLCIEAPSPPDFEDLLARISLGDAISK